MIEMYLLEQLAEFEKQKTLSGAAEKLSISQPALSRSMQKLEEKIGVPLFERRRNKLTLNKNGELAADYARRILAEEKEMVERVQAFDYSMHAITFGSSGPGPNLYYKPVLSALYPDKTVTAVLENEEALLDGLRTGAYQCIFLPHEIKYEGLFCTRAASEQLYLAVLPSHPAASLNSISFREMDGESFFMYHYVGFWNEIVRKHMPNAKFLLHHEYEDFGELTNNISLPCFGSNLAALSTPDCSTKRVFIPFSDREAYVTYYFVCRSADKKQYQEFIAGLDGKDTAFNR